MFEQKQIKEFSEDASRCPFFNKYYVGTCSRYELFYVPGLEERKKYCLNTAFKSCYLYRKYASKDNV